MVNNEAKFETDSFPKRSLDKRECRDFFQEALNNNLGCFSIVDKQKNQFIGSTRFYFQDDSDKSIKLGYTFLSPEYWGSGANGHIKKYCWTIFLTRLKKFIST
jgi:isoleucyl-tRNA synthetase